MLRSMIERPALTEGLVGRDGFVTLLAAAGAGKTTVLRQWDAADARPFVWLAPDDAAHAVALVARVAAGETGPLVSSAVIEYDRFMIGGMMPAGEFCTSAPQ